MRWCDGPTSWWHERRLQGIGDRWVAGGAMLPLRGSHCPPPSAWGNWSLIDHPLDRLTTLTVCTPLRATVVAGRRTGRRARLRPRRAGPVNAHPTSSAEAPGLDLLFYQPA